MQDSYLGLRCPVFTTAVSKARPVPSKLDILRWLISDFRAFYKQPRKITCGHMVEWSAKESLNCVMTVPLHFSYFLSHCSFALFLKSIKIYSGFVLQRALIVLGKRGRGRVSIANWCTEHFCTGTVNGYPEPSVVCSLKGVLFLFNSS